MNNDSQHTTVEVQVTADGAPQSANANQITVDTLRSGPQVIVRVTGPLAAFLDTDMHEIFKRNGIVHLVAEDALQHNAGPPTR